MRGHHRLAGAITAGLLAFSLATGTALAAFPHEQTQLEAQAELKTLPLAHAIENAFNQSFSNPSFRERRDHAAARLFYEGRGFQPVWFKGTQLTPLGQSVITHLQNASDDGLNPADYPVPAVNFNELGYETLEAIALAEIMISESALMYAEDAQAGRISPKQVSSDFDQKPERPDPLQALESIAASAAPASTLAAFNPPHEGYKALRAQLKLLQTQGQLEKDVVIVPPEGKLLKRGSKGERVALLRQRLEVPSTPETERLFDADLEEAVKAFQRANGLVDDGVVGKQSLLSLNARVTGNPIHDVIANMERWRWLPRDMGDLHIKVNVPEFMVRLKQEDVTLYEERVVVGQRKHKTPIFSDVMNHVIVNPYWNVPYSIASKELLPEMLPDPASYLRQGNYELIANGRIVDPYHVNWEAVTFRQLRIRQRPGRGNALGNIKFMFPNKHNVYLHDTPSKSLFKRSERAFSHGCIRVRNPLDFAAVLMSFQPDLSGNYIRRLVGGKETQVNLQVKYPVHITYFTAFADENGNLQRRPDIYGHNQKTIDALGLL